MKTYFIVNPTSGNKTALKTIKSLINKTDFDYEIIETEYQHHAIRIVKSIGEKGEKCRVFACGGDGSLFDVVNGAVGFDNIEVGIIPCGSGNDYIKYYGDKRKFLSEDYILNGKSMPIDLIKCNDKYCVNIASIGMDAYVCQQKEKMKFLSKISGSLAYIVAVFITFIFHMSEKFKVKIGDEDFFEKELMFIVAANGRYYGGSFNPTPDAVVNDGLIDAMTINKVSRLQVLDLIGKYQKGTHVDIKDLVSVKKVKRVEVISEKVIPVNLDGELFDSDTAVFEIVEKAVNFIVPPNILDNIKRKEFVEKVWNPTIIWPFLTFLQKTLDFFKKSIKISYVLKCNFKVRRFYYDN